MAEADGRPPFDEERARSFVGKKVLVGLSYEDSAGKPLGQHQLHGRIVAVDAHHGLCLQLAGLHAGKYYWLPPDFRSWLEARPGEYRLRSTGEVLSNPDVLCNWIVTRDDGLMPSEPSGLLDPDPTERRYP